MTGRKVNGHGKLIATLESGRGPAMVINKARRAIVLHSTVGVQEHVGIQEQMGIQQPQLRTEGSKFECRNCRIAKAMELGRPGKTLNPHDSIWW